MTKYFGEFGGQYVGEVLKPAMMDLERAYKEIVPSEAFQKEFQIMLRFWLSMRLIRN